MIITFSHVSPLPAADRICQASDLRKLPAGFRQVRPAARGSRPPAWLCGPSRACYTQSNRSHPK
jgi:hypothetical protein